MPTTWCGYITAYRVRKKAEVRHWGGTISKGIVGKNIC